MCAYGHTGTILKRYIELYTRIASKLGIHLQIRIEQGLKYTYVSHYENANIS